MPNYIKKTLKNGVKLYLYLDKNMKQSFVSYMVDYGSSGKWYDFYLNDKLYHVMPGCAHFLEHMLGEHSRYGNFYKYMASKKYYKNGITSFNNTWYFFKGTEDILESIKKLIHVVDDPVFTTEDVEETKYAIIEETKRGKNNKVSILNSLVYRNLYKDLDILTDSLNTIGDEETTKAIDYDMLKVCYDAFYYDENKTLLVAGNYDEKELTDYIEDVYKEIPPHKKKMKEYSYGNLDKIKKKYDTYKMVTNDDIIGIAFKELSKGYTKKEIRYYLSFISDYFFSNASNFVNTLKKQDILVSTNGFTRLFVNDDYYHFSFIATVKDKKSFETELIKELKSKPFDKKDFDLFIRSSIASQALLTDFKYGAFNDFVSRKEFSDDFEDIDFLRNLTYEKFLEFYEGMDFDNYVVGVITNE